MRTLCLYINAVVAYPAGQQNKTKKSRKNAQTRDTLIRYTNTQGLSQNI